MLATAAVAGAAVYAVYASDREYSRLITAGDEAQSADRSLHAIEAYSAAIALRPDSMLAHLKRGIIYRSRGELTQALADLRRAAELDPTATRPAELAGDTHFSLERFDQAAARYETYLSLDDRTPRVWYKLGLARYRAGRLEAAIAPLQKAVALDKTMAEAHYLLGLCQRDRKRIAAARTSLETAARLAPGLTGPREALAGLYRAGGEPARGIDQLEALAALDYTQPDRLVALGLAHARSRRFEAAVLILSRAVERFPDEPQVYAALGSVWLDAAEVRDDSVALKKAIEALSTAAGYVEVTSAALSDLGRAQMMAGNTAAADRALRQAVDRLPIDPDAFVHLSTLARRANRILEARDALIQYAALVGDREPIVPLATQIASDSIRLGDHRVALRWIERAVDDAGTTPALAALRRRAQAMQARTNLMQ